MVSNICVFTKILRYVSEFPFPVNGRMSYSKIVKLLQAKVLLSQTRPWELGMLNTVWTLCFKLTFGVGMDLEEMVPFLSPEGTEQWRQLGKTQSSHISEQCHLSIKWTKVAVTSCQSSQSILGRKGSDSCH